MSAFGIRLKRARLIRGLGVNELERKAGMSPGAVSRYERGSRGKTPEAETIEKLAGALGVRQAWLLHGRGPMDGDRDDHDGPEDQRALAARIAMEGGVPEDAVRWVLEHPEGVHLDKPALYWIQWMLQAWQHFALQAYVPRPPSSPPGPLTPTLPSHTYPPPSPSGKPSSRRTRASDHPEASDLRDTKKIEFKR